MDDGFPTGNFIKSIMSSKELTEEEKGILLEKMEFANLVEPIYITDNFYLKLKKENYLVCYYKNLETSFTAKTNWTDPSIIINIFKQSMKNKAKKR